MIKTFQRIIDFFTPSRSLLNPDHWLTLALKESGGVTGSKALQQATVYACIKILSETIPSLPLKCYERIPTGGKEDYGSYFLNKVIRKPNILQSQFEFWETLITQICLRGNYYTGKNYSRGFISELIPMNPLGMTPKIENGKIIYEYTNDKGMPSSYPQNRISHFKNFTLDGLIGLSPIECSKKSIDLAQEAENHGYTYYKNGARTGGFVKHPGRLKDTAYKNLQTSLNKKASGDQKFKIQILEENMDWIASGLTNEDSQYLQTREFSVEEICRIFRVPIELVQHRGSNNSYASVEQFFLSFGVYTIIPWLKRLENRILLDWIPEEDQDSVFYEFKIGGLLRGDVKSRYEAYRIAREWGWMNADEIRELENMNPMPDGKGKIYFMPLNMEDIGNPRKPKEKVDARTN